MSDERKIRTALSHNTLPPVWGPVYVTDDEFDALERALTEPQEPTESNAELLPCPFCGSIKVGLAASQNMADGRYIEPREWSVLCTTCGASCSLHCESEQDAKLSWNLRRKG